jgi:methyltransferase (TIGR00027 family)
MVLRTRYFDDFLLRVSEQEGIRQILLMAAGLDTRAFRLDWAEGTRLFELDQPAVLRYKQEILDSLGARPTCDRRFIPADLTKPWDEILTNNGFDSQKPSCWLLEGFLFYLPNEAITEMIHEVTGLAAPGSWMGFDINNSDMLTSSWTRAWVDMQSQMGAPWIGTLDDPENYLSALGW